MPEDYYLPSSIDAPTVLQANFLQAGTNVASRYEVSRLMDIQACIRQEVGGALIEKKEGKPYQNWFCKTNPSCDGKMQVKYESGPHKPGVVKSMTPCTCRNIAVTVRDAPGNKPTAKQLRHALVAYFISKEIALAGYAATPPPRWEGNKVISGTNDNEGGIPKYSLKGQSFFGKLLDGRWFEIKLKRTLSYVRARYIPENVAAIATKPVPLSAEEMAPDPSGAATVSNHAPNPASGSPSLFASTNSSTGHDKPVCAICLSPNAVYTLLCSNAMCSPLFCPPCLKKSCWMRLPEVPDIVRSEVDISEPLKNTVPRSMQCPLCRSTGITHYCFLDEEAEEKTKMPLDLPEFFVFNRPARDENEAMVVQAAVQEFVVPIHMKRAKLTRRIVHLNTRLVEERNHRNGLYSTGLMMEDIEALIEKDEKELKEAEENLTSTKLPEWASDWTMYSDVPTPKRKRNASADADGRDVVIDVDAVADSSSEYEFEEDNDDDSVVVLEE